MAYEAVDRAVKEGVDVLFVDTAGRLQTKVNLMEELTKIRQVLGKKHPGAPHRSILVIDATTVKMPFHRPNCLRKPQAWTS